MDIDPFLTMDMMLSALFKRVITCVKRCRARADSARACVHLRVRCTGRLKDVHQCTGFITGPVNYSAQVPQIRLGGIAACSEDLQLFVNRSRQHFGLFD